MNEKDKKFINDTSYYYSQTTDYLIECVGIYLLLFMGFLFSMIVYKITSDFFWIIFGIFIIIIGIPNNFIYIYRMKKLEEEDGTS